MKYKIERTEKKTTQRGKPFLKAVLKDERGQLEDNVLIWPDFPNFERLDSGAETTGTVETNARGYKSLKPAAFRSMEHRARETRFVPNDERIEFMRLAQQRKHEAIAYFNATNSAIALVSNLKSKLMNTTNRTIVKQEIEYWRDWFLEEWRKQESKGSDTN